MEKKYYDNPTQVAFLDFDGDLSYGIAYKDEIICACCGSVFEIEEVEIIKELDWLNFEDFIKDWRTAKKLFGKNWKEKILEQDEDFFDESFYF